MNWDWREEFVDRLLAAARRASRVKNFFRRTQVLPEPKDSEAIALRSGERVLDARFVPGRAEMPLVLFCHGIGDTLRNWTGVQAFFQERGIGSFVFSYSGYAKSTGRVRARHYDEDFLVAYAEVLRRVLPEQEVFVLGYSLGTGVAARGVARVQRKPAGLFLCSGFTTFREAGLVIGAPRWLTRCVPDVWCSRDHVREMSVPVVVVHSDGDELFPVRMGEELAASRAGTELVVTRGFAHADPFFTVAEGYWGTVVERMLLER